MLRRVTTASVVMTAVLGAAGVVLAGCSSVGGSAIRTGPVQLPARSGPVAVYASGQPPAGATDLGVVEVHAAQQEATVDVLLPQFVAKVAQIGGDVAVIDGIRARFEVLPRTHVETFYYSCGFGATCAGQRVYAANDELMVVSIFGHAFTTRAIAPSAPLMPRDLDEPPSEDPSPPSSSAPSDSGRDL